MNLKKSLPFFIGLFLFILLGCSSSSNGSDDDTITDDDTSGLTGDPFQDFPDNFQGTGDSANDFLSNSTYDRLEVQIAFVDGFRPTQDAMDNFEDYLREFTFKENIDIIYTELESPDEEELTLPEISELELENRTSYNDGSTLAIYIYFADAPSDGDDLDEGLVTLGAVYRNTSMVIFESTIRDLASRSILITNADVETATLNHEFGHLFGLVNLGSNPITVNNHEDTESANHCTIDGCLMRAELQFTAGKNAKELHNSCSLSADLLIKSLETRAANGLAAPPELGHECRLDIEANGARVTSTSAKASVQHMGLHAGH